MGQCPNLVYGGAGYGIGVTICPNPGAACSGHAGGTISRNLISDPLNFLKSGHKRWIARCLRWITEFDRQEAPAFLWHDF